MRISDWSSDVCSSDLPAERHVARFGNDVEYRIKARVPAHLHGRIPPVLGRKAPLSLVSLGTTLGIGGMPAAKAASKQHEQPQPTQKSDKRRPETHRAGKKYGHQCRYSWSPYQ